MVIQVVSLFPTMLAPVIASSMLGRAQALAGVEIRLVGMRPFGIGRHHQADDYPFGGGPGMLLRADVVVPAVEWAMMHHREPATILWTSPQGRRLDQKYCQELAQKPHLIIVAGHYEGIDERAIDILGGTEVSVGDYVLTGGELPALTLVDAVVRLQPGVLGAEEGAANDSFSNRDLLEGPQYTRPEHYRGRSVPAILLSGNHRAILKWKQQAAVQRTQARRSDLLSGRIDDGN